MWWVAPVLGLMGVAVTIANGIIFWLVNKVLAHERQLGERKTYSETRWDEVQNRLHSLESAEDLKRRLDRIERKLFNGHKE